MLHSPFFSFTTDVVSVYFDKRVSRSGAELAYFFTLTLFPLLICVNALSDLVHLNESPFVELLSGFLPKSSAVILTDYLDYIAGNQSTTLFIGGLILMISSSSAAFRCLLNITGDIYGQPLFSGLRNLIVSFLSSVLLLLVLYISILLLVTGDWFIAFLNVQFGLSSAIFFAWRWLRFLLLFAFLFGMLFLYYRVPVIRRRRRPPVIWGTLFSSASLVGVSIIFSWFIGMSSRYQLVYGSLAAIIILMLWLYLCGNILILGSVLNYVYGERWQARHLGG
ncbi:MAG: YihY/virulence factor BrkB family protein [Oscillospiraceae bacterium]